MPDSDRDIESRVCETDCSLYCPRGQSSEKKMKFHIVTALHCQSVGREKQTGRLKETVQHLISSTNSIILHKVRHKHMQC